MPVSTLTIVGLDKGGRGQAQGGQCSWLCLRMQLCISTLTSLLEKHLNQVPTSNKTDLSFWKEQSKADLAYFGTIDAIS